QGVGSAATLAPMRTNPPYRGQVCRKSDVSAGGWTGGRYGGRGGGAGPGRRRSSSGRRARPPAHIGVTIGGGRPMGARGCGGRRSPGDHSFGGTTRAGATR